MATQPVVCPVPTLPGFTFFKGNLVLDDGTKSSPPIYMQLKDMIEDVQAFSKSSVTVKSSRCFLLSQTDIGDSLGYVSYIAVKATYPASVLESKKYMTWEYEGITYNMGTLMVLSGPRLSATSSVYEGWLLSKPGQYSQSGGIVFCNPHTDIDIKLEILVAR